MNCDRGSIDRVGNPSTFPCQRCGRRRWKLGLLGQLVDELVTAFIEGSHMGFDAWRAPSVNLIRQRCKEI